jgi:hypothetical protein
VKTEKQDNEKILLVKKLVKPATKQLSFWKHLREFRNEAIAHNHRDKQGNNIYLAKKLYDVPEGSELLFMIYCLKKMVDVLSTFFCEELKNSIHAVAEKRTAFWPKSSASSKRNFLRKKEEIDKQIDEPVASIILKMEILDTIVESFGPSVPTISVH